MRSEKLYQKDIIILYKDGAALELVIENLHLWENIFVNDI